MAESIKRPPTITQALIPLSCLIFMLSASVFFFGEDSSYGPNQIALILSAFVAVIVGLLNGFRWKELEEGLVQGISLAMGAMLILLAVGALIGSWILAGVVPTMIYWGLQILHPSVFFAAALIICALVAVATGSSWTTVSTIGIALVGIAQVMGLHPGITAGAIISGAYFGDKLSPLSDTTNLAPAMAGTDLFTHIRHMLWTTVPSMVIALILFSILGLTAQATGTGQGLDVILEAIQTNFNVGWYMLLPLVVVIVLVMRKVPAMPALLIGALLGGVWACLFQQESVLRFVGDTDLPRGLALVKGVWTSLFAGFTSTTGNKELDDLLTRGGMESMLSVVWLIMSAMMFGGTMEKTGLLQTIANRILGFAHSTGSLILSTLVTSIGMNIVASDQYIAIVVPGRMYRAEFKRRGLHPKNLSRALEDAGTLTSPLVPWNTCGAFMAQNLAVPTLTYLPFCFFNLMNPILSAIYGFTGFSIEKLEDESSPAKAA